VLDKFFEGWKIEASNGELVPVHFTYAPHKVGEYVSPSEYFGFYYDDPVKNEQGRVFIRR
jgi:hypothetical protein